MEVERQQYDLLSYIRKTLSNYDISLSITINEVMETYFNGNSPSYVSIDTEGSEFEILNSFNFDEYDIKIITCEHNFTPMREKIHSLLTRNGYVRKYSEYSLFDDWYVKR